MRPEVIGQQLHDLADLLRLARTDDEKRTVYPNVLGHIARLRPHVEALRDE